MQMNTSQIARRHESKIVKGVEYPLETKLGEGGKRKDRNIENYSKK